MKIIITDNDDMILAKYNQDDLIKELNNEIGYDNNINDLNDADYLDYILETINDAIKKFELNVKDL